MADRDIGLAIYLATTLRKPLLVEGEPGYGKTDIAKALVVDAIGSPPSVGGRHGRGSSDRLHDVLVPRAAAQVPRNRHTDLLLRGRLVRLEEFVRGEDDAGSAVAELEAMVLLERLLDGMHLAMGGQPLNRQDLRAVCLDREHRAVLDRAAVHDDDARPAMARVASDVHAREPQLVPQEVDEERPRLDGPLAAGAVHRNPDRASVAARRLR